MLVLTRRRGQGIRIGRDVCVKVVSVKGDRVLIGIAAPNDLAILRDEVKLRHDTAERVRDAAGLGTAHDHGNEESDDDLPNL